MTMQEHLLFASLWQLVKSLILAVVKCTMYFVDYKIHGARLVVINCFIAFC